jgi:hypothetical protein
VAIRDRLKKLEDANPALCEERPCKRITITEVEYIDGRRFLVKGEEPAPLCEVCPRRDDPKAPVRHIEVVRNPYTRDDSDVPDDPEALTYP